MIFENLVQDYVLADLFILLRQGDAFSEVVGGDQIELRCATVDTLRGYILWHCRQEKNFAKFHVGMMNNWWFNFNFNFNYIIFPPSIIFG